MIKKVNERIVAWKKLFTEGREDVNETSSWKDILLALNMTANETADILEKAIEQCGVFSNEEKKALYALPYYHEVVELLRELPNDSFGNFFGSALPNGDTICFLRRPKLEENAQTEVILVDVTIVTKTPVPYNIDAYVFITDLQEIKNVTIGYAKEIPQEWLDEKQKWEKEQEADTLTDDDDFDEAPDDDDEFSETPDDDLPF